MRFGYQFFEQLFKRYRCEIVVIDKSESASPEQELAEDLVNIVQHFSVKIYGKRTYKSRIYGKGGFEMATVRTIKQYSELLTALQQKQLMDVLKPYNKQIDVFLTVYAHLKFLHLVTNSSGQKQLRDFLIKNNFKSPCGLQARQWKMALVDACEIIHRQWESDISFVQNDYLYKHKKLTEQEKHYANWLLIKSVGGRDFSRILAIFNNTDTTYNSIELDEKGRKKIRHYLHRCFLKTLGNRPRKKSSRSINCDPQLYDIKWDEEKKCQVLELTTLQPRKRLCIHLRGVLTKKGNARIVFDAARSRIEVHQTRKVKTKCLGKKVASADYGMSEVLTDETGKQYGNDLWRRLSKQNNYLLEKGRNRNKIYQVALKSSQKKKKRMLDTSIELVKNRDRMIHKHQEAIKSEINHGFRSFAKERKFKLVGFEDISGMSAKTKFKGLSRRVSLWTRGYLRDRLEFLSEVYDFTVRYVNCAYTSQECNKCCYVHKENRNGDKFECKHCGHKIHADHKAAISIGERMQDKEINVRTPFKEVKRILQARHEKKKAM